MKRKPLAALALAALLCVWAAPTPAHAGHHCHVGHASFHGYGSSFGSFFYAPVALPVVPVQLAPVVPVQAAPVELAAVQAAAAPAYAAPPVIVAAPIQDYAAPVSYGVGVSYGATYGSVGAFSGYGYAAHSFHGSHFGGFRQGFHDGRAFQKAVPTRKK